MIYLNAAIVPAITPTIALTTKYNKNNSNMIKDPLNKISVAHIKENKF